MGKIPQSFKGNLTDGVVEVYSKLLQGDDLPVCKFHACRQRTVRIARSTNLRDPHTLPTARGTEQYASFLLASRLRHIGRADLRAHRYRRRRFQLRVSPYDDLATRRTRPLGHPKTERTPLLAKKKLYIFSRKTIEQTCKKQVDKPSFSQGDGDFSKYFTIIEQNLRVLHMFSQDKYGAATGSCVRN